MDRECFACGETENLHGHHIDGSGKTANPNNDPSNIMILCQGCHQSLHHGHPRGRLRKIRSEFFRHMNARKKALANGDLLRSALHESQMRRLSYIGKYVTGYTKPGLVRHREKKRGLYYHFVFQQKAQA